MREYILWKQVYERLRRHEEQMGSPYSFFDAARELWQEGKFNAGAELPAVSFSRWDGEDLGVLEALLGETAVDLNIFLRDFRNRKPAQDASRHILSLDVSPMRIANHQSMGVHNHDAFELVFNLRGDTRLVLEGGGHGLPVDGCCIVAPGVFHDVLAGENGLPISICLAEQTVEKSLFRLLREESVLTNFFRSGLSENGGYILFPQLPRERLRDCLRGILHETYANEPYAGILRTNHVESLFAYLLRYGTSAKLCQTGGRRTGATNMLAALKHIQTHYRTTSLGETAALFHYEASYLGKQIKLYTGKNFSTLICELRMEEAKKLLAESALPAEKVGQRAGFESPVHFSRTFKKVTGMTPGEYRRRVAGKGDTKNTENDKVKTA